MKTLNYTMQGFAALLRRWEDNSVSGLRFISWICRLIFVTGLLVASRTSQAQIWTRMVKETGATIQAVSPEKVPFQGTFWSLQHTNFAPLP